MHLELFKSKLLSFPVCNDFPEMREMLSRAVDRDGASWDYVFYACEAAGGYAMDALDAAAANFCMLTGIHLVDDMLDNDPKGDYHHYGIGTCANMALAFHSLGLQIIEQSALSLQNKFAIFVSLNQMMLDTAGAQQKDVFGKSLTEEDYWNKISAKTPPLFSSALFSGAIYGGATISEASRVAALGKPIGKIIQVSDDLSDIYQDSIEPDWTSPRNNLALLYCLEAEYNLKPDFLALIDNIDNREKLKQAQQIVTCSGALSYCIYHILALYKELIKQIENLDLLRPDQLERMAMGLINPAMELIKLSGVKDPKQYLEMEFKTFEQ